MPRPNRSLRRYLLVASLSLAVLAVAGWAIWQPLGGTDDEDGDGPSAASSPSTAAPPSASDSPSPRGTTRSREARADAEPLAGKVIVLDPGHNPSNREHTAEINRTVDIGTGSKACDTTGTATNDGYSEAAFTLDVARRTRAILEDQGAEVKLTQDGKRAFGPCIDERAAIGNKADADAVVSIHADGGGAGSRGFHVILPAPVSDGQADTTAIAKPSRALGEQLKAHFAERTGSKPSNYVGEGSGFTVRNDLGGLNLSSVPKVFIECGNMRDAKDAALLKDAEWRGQAARGIADGVTAFLES